MFSITSSKIVHTSKELLATNASAYRIKYLLRKFRSKSEVSAQMFGAVPMWGPQNFGSGLSVGRRVFKKLKRQFYLPSSVPHTSSSCEI